MNRVRDEFSKMHPDRRIGPLQDTLSSLFDEEQAHELLSLQIGPNYTTSIEPSLAEASNKERRTTLTALKRYSDPLWPFLLFHRPTLEQVLPEKHLQRDYSKDVIQFLAGYDTYAEQLGLYPHPPTLDMVPRQRELDHKMREQAVRLKAISTMIEGRDFRTGYYHVMEYIQNAIEILSQHSITELQEAIIIKMGNDQEKINDLKTYELWDDIDSCAIMCIDRGARTFVDDNTRMLEQITGGEQQYYSLVQRFGAQGGTHRGLYLVL
jgi:hypothetical protein